jgi:hypothetical protein
MQISNQRYKEIPDGEFCSPSPGTRLAYARRYDTHPSRNIYTLLIETEGNSLLLQDAEYVYIQPANYRRESSSRLTVITEYFVDVKLCALCSLATLSKSHRDERNLHTACDGVKDDAWSCGLSLIFPLAGRLPLKKSSIAEM